MGLQHNELSVFLHIPSVPRGCGPPPPLQNGDIRESVRVHYRHNERVEYICKSYHIMQGPHVKTCSNGDWIGEDMTCLSKLLSVVSKIENTNRVCHQSQYGGLRLFLSL